MSFGFVRFGPLRLLLLLILILAGGLAWIWLDQHAQLRNLAWVAPKALPPDIKVPAGPPKAGSIAADAARYAVILERPLFAPDRRPPPPPPPPTPPPPPDPLANIQIQGIFSGINAGIIARVEGKMRRVKINESIGPWTLKSIDGRDVTFASGDKNRKLHLAYARLDATVPTPKPASVKASSPAPAAANPAPAGVSLPRNTQDVVRERLLRLNEYRAGQGLPPLDQ